MFETPFAARAIACFLSAALLLIGAPAAGLNPDRTILQYKHTRWTGTEGPVAGIIRIAQSPDGYLWLAAFDGLYRFDGLVFERIDHELGRGAEDYPTGLLAARNGDVWVYYHVSKSFAVYRGGRLRNVAAPKPDGTVIGLEQTPDGDIWVAGGRPGQPMLRYHKGAWLKVQPTGPNVHDTNMGMQVTADGALWVAYIDAVYRLPLGGSGFQRIISDPGAKMRLSLDPDGRLWVTGVSGSRPITEPGGRWTGHPAAFRYPSDNFQRRGFSIFDRQGNLWVARRKDGVERLRRPSPLGPHGRPDRPEEYRAKDGLTSDAAYTIFEDKEGDIWVGTTSGLDRFRDADIVTEPLMNAPASYGDILFADSRGRVFIGEGDAVYRVDPGGSPVPVLTKVIEPEAICEGPHGAIWIALADHIAVLDGDRIRRVAKPPGLATGIKDCGVDRWGRFWFSAESDGLLLMTKSGWRKVPVKSAKPFKPIQMAFDSSGDLWVNGGPGALARIDRSGPVFFDLSRMGSDEVRTMAAARDGLLLAGYDTVGLIRHGRLLVASAAQVGSLLQANGLVQNPQGETWIYTRHGFTRLRSGDLDRAFRDGRFRVPVRRFGSLDGLVDSNAVRPPRALVRGGDGRLWGSTATATVTIDPARLTFNPLPPKITIRSIQTATQKVLDPVSVQLAAGSTNISIAFAAMGLRMPEGVEVRYRLEGQDAAWINPGTRRQAFYTNLEPGTYRFQIVAANEDGIWDKKGSILEFNIAPTFAQSVWFKMLLVLLLALLVAAGYFLRVRRVTARLQSGFEVRIAERERIARELHDTLLQGFQGLLLQFKAVTKQLPEDHRVRQPLDRALYRAQQALVDGRERVQELRPHEGPNDLADALLRRASEVIGESPRVCLVQEGTARQLHPLVREELERIVEEAVRNAVAHAEASSIELLLLWSRKGLRLAVRDDGVGIPASVLNRGKREGHFGLIGMRERATRIGGALTVTSHKAAGTEVSLDVPARAAFIENSLALHHRLLWPWTRQGRASKTVRTPADVLTSQPTGAT